MKKRLVSTVIAVVVLMAACVSANAAVDLSSVRNNDMFTIDVNDNGNAFISTIIPFQEMTFSHKNSVEDVPSYLYSDIIILDYFEANPTAAWRIWFDYNAQRYLGITSVTIIMNGNEYTFTGMGGKDRMTSHDTYVTETPNILLGTNNTEFWLMLLLDWEAADSTADIWDRSFPMILHGTEDIETEIPGAAIVDMCVMGETFITVAGFEGFADTEGTALTVKYKETEEETADTQE